MSVTTRKATVERAAAAEPDDFALDLADENNWRSLIQHRPADDLR